MASPVTLAAVRWIAALCFGLGVADGVAGIRTARKRLVVFSTSISLGIAALVALACLGRICATRLRPNRKSLLGADLVFMRREPFAPEDRRLIQRFGGKIAEETSFSTMLSLESGTRLVNARAITGEFPFYGTLETDPPSAAAAFRRGEGLLVEQGVLFQFGAKDGDSADWVRVRFDPRCLETCPGDTVAFSTLAPRVYLPGRIWNPHASSNRARWHAIGF
jgi:putative ABC transport system permease protein